LRSSEDEIRAFRGVRSVRVGADLSDEGVTSIKRSRGDGCLKVNEWIRAEVQAIEHVQHANALDDEGALQQSAPQILVPEIIGEANASVFEIVVQMDSPDR
jgi:hypothetical protein